MGCLPFGFNPWHHPKSVKSEPQELLSVGKLSLQSLPFIKLMRYCKSTMKKEDHSDNILRYKNLKPLNFNSTIPLRQNKKKI